MTKTPKQHAVKITITAYVDYDRSVFGAIGKAEETATTFETDLREIAESHGVKIAALSKKHDARLG